MLKTNSSLPHFHVYAGSPGILPFVDLLFDETEQDDAVVHFFKMSDAMVGKYVEAETRLGAERGLYLHPEYLETNGVLAEFGPFRIVLVKCQGCFSPILN